MPAFASSLLRATARKAFTVSSILKSVLNEILLALMADTGMQPSQTRFISSTVSRQNEATAVPLAERVRSVAQRAQQGVLVKAGEEGFKTGVLATLLGGSALAAGYLIMAPSVGKEVNGNELL